MSGLPGRSARWRRNRYPSACPSESVFDYDIINENSDTLNVNVTVFPKTVIASYQEVFKLAGLTPISFVLEGQAIAHSVISKGDTQTYMIVDFGRTRSGLSIVKNGVVSFSSTVDVGGDEISCDDASLIGLGLVSNKGAFDLEEGELVRFGDDDNVNEKGNGGKKGKSVAINMTKLFVWTGFVCDATELDGNDDNKLTFSDFDVNMDDVINATDIAVLNQTAIFGEVFTVATLTAAELVVTDDGDPATVTNSNDEIDLALPDEFDAWIDIILGAIVDGGFTNDDGLPICQEFFSEWVFNVADIVLFGFDYENKGASLTQLRFYPVEETFFTSEG